MDLNKLPPDVDIDLIFGIDEDSAANNPSYCTQHAPTTVEGPSVSDIRLSLEETHIGVQETENAHDGHDGGQGIENAADGHGDAENNLSQPDEVEVWSTPEGPYTGKTFESLEEARLYYNSYAKRKGFSVRTNTSRRGLTGSMEKVQFVCNKEGKGKVKSDGSAAKALADSKSDDSEQDHDQYEEAITAAKGSKKRKRETMVYTQCKARMVVKQIGARWHIIYFIGEHNHDLITKPSLTKFLRSHKGIPPEEKKLIRLMHGSNIESGRIMQLMTEFYGSRKLVPYETKDVHNFRFTNLSVDLGKIAREASNSDDACAIVNQHIVMMNRELQELKKKRRKKSSTTPGSNGGPAAAANGSNGGAATENDAATSASASAPTNTATAVPTAATLTDTNATVPDPINLQDASIPGTSGLVGNPPKSAVKGRKKSKRLSNGMNAQPKRKKRCSVCNSDQHTAPKCPNKIEKRCPAKEINLFI
ncbi:hypothetical protein EJB05_55232, partial [Eragrostis curvula]